MPCQSQTLSYIFFFMHDETQQKELVQASDPRMTRNALTRYLDKVSPNQPAARKVSLATLSRFLLPAY